MLYRKNDLVIAPRPDGDEHRGKWHYDKLGIIEGFKCDGKIVGVKFIHPGKNEIVLIYFGIGQLNVIEEAFDYNLAIDFLIHDQSREYKL